MSVRYLVAAMALVAPGWGCSGERVQCEECACEDGGTGGSGGVGATGGVTGGTGGADTGGSSGEAGAATGGSGAGAAGGSAGSAGSAGQGARGGAPPSGAAGAAGSGEEPVTTCWANTYGTALDEEGGGVLRTDDGWYWVRGISCDVTGNCDTVLLHVAPDGTLERTRAYGGADDDFVGFRLLPDGGLVAGGFTRSFGANAWDTWVLRLDSAGDVLWQKALDGGDYDHLSPPLPATDGDFILVGETRSFGEPDGWLVKLSEAGDLVWQRRYDMRDYDRLNSIVPVPNGYVAVGYTTDANNQQDAWIIGVTLTGQFMWSRTYAGDGADYLASVTRRDDGTLLAQGYTQSAGAGNNDTWLLELDTNGNVLSSRTYGTAEWDYLTGRRILPDGSMVLAGTTRYGTTTGDDGLLVRLSPSGDVEWARAFGTEDEQDKGSSWGGNLASGSTQSWGAGEDDILLIQPLPDGTCPGLDLRDIPLEMNTFFPAVRNHVLIASNTTATIRDTDAVPVDLTLDQQSLF